MRVRWALVGLGIHLVVVVGLLVDNGWRPEYFVHFGHQSTMTPYAQQQIREDLLIPHRDGHDGQTFWVLARDPFLLDTETTGPLLEGRPVYRAQRMLYPLLASPWHLAGEQALLWGLIVVNLAAVAVGSYFTAALVLDHGVPGRASLAFALNPGLLLATLLNTSETLSLAGAIAFIYFVRRNRIGPALVAGVLAVLAREPTWLVLAGVAAFAPRLPLRTRVILAAVPAASAGIWGLYTRWRFDWPPTGAQELGLPFEGYIESWRDAWSPIGYWDDAVGAAVTVIAAVYVLWRWVARRDGSLLLAGAVPVAALVFVLTFPVVSLFTNSLRVSAPLLTLAALHAMASAYVRPAGVEEQSLRPA